MDNKKLLTTTQKELADILRVKLNDDDAYLGTMLALIAGQPDADKNCTELLKFMRENPDASYEQILLKSDDILGIEDPFKDGK